MNKIIPPEFVTFYMWDTIQANTVAVWYPDGTSEYLEPNGKWVKGHNWFAAGIQPADILICEIRD